MSQLAEMSVDSHQGELIWASVVRPLLYFARVLSLLRLVVWVLGCFPLSFETGSCCVSLASLESVVFLPHCAKCGITGTVWILHVP